MGLDTPEIIEAENKVVKATSESQVNNTNAEQDLNKVERDVEKNNNNAQDEVKTAQETAKIQNDEANWYVKERPEFRIISDEQFEKAQKLERIILPQNIEVIETYALKECLELKEISINGTNSIY